MDIQPELPDRLARDLDGSFEELVRGHERLVFGLALRVVGDRADAEPAQVAERGQERELLVGLLAALPRPYREAVVLRHVEGLPYSEVAEVLGRPVGTVKTHVHRGVRQLRVMLERREERVPR